MISVEEVKNFLGNVDISDSAVQEAIELALQRFVKLTGRQPQDTAQDRKALKLLAVAELSSRVNLYWRKEGELMRVKDLMLEVERLLGLRPRGAIAWAEI